MSSAAWGHQIDLLVRARTPLIWVRSNEEARVENLLDAWYATSGVLAELEVFLREVPDASDPRFIGPSMPRSAFGGVRVRF